MKTLNIYIKYISQFQGFHLTLPRILYYEGESNENLKYLY